MAHFASLIAVFSQAGLAVSAASAQYEQPYPQTYPQTYPQNYPQSYPQSYPQTYPQSYPQQGYSHPDQDYGSQNAIGAIIDSLIGNRYNVSDRQAIRQCAFAAVQRARSRYPGGYPQSYPGYNNAVRVTAITDVERRSGGIRVRGMLGNRQGYNQPYDQRFPNGGGDRWRGADRWRGGDFGFRCDVDYRGYVREVRFITGNRGY